MGPSDTCPINTGKDIHELIDCDIGMASRISWLTVTLDMMSMMS